MKELKKYYIGFVVLGVFALVMLGFVIYRASSYKQDKQLNKAAYEIANDLNNYISNESKIPESLSDATDKEIPKQISYTKQSSKEYKFCVTYANSSTSTTKNPSEILFSGLYGNFGQNYSDYNYKSSFKASTLYISTFSWSKGEQCEEIKPNISSVKYYDKSGSDSIDMDFVCEDDYQYREFYDKYCVDGKYVSPY